MILKLTLSGRRALDKLVLRQSAWKINPNWDLHPGSGVATTEIHGHPAHCVYFTCLAFERLRLFL